MGWETGTKCTKQSLTGCHKKKFKGGDALLGEHVTSILNISEILILFICEAL